jgi:hypothetical protein
MSASPGTFGERLPEWARPREREERGSGRVRLVESTLLVIVGLLLAIATVNDVVLATHVNHRLVADLQTWRAYTHHDYKNLSISQDHVTHTTRDIVCGNTQPGPPKERVQVCLRVTGPVRGGRRAVRGGWYLPAGSEDVAGARYGCFGPARSDGLCQR